MIEISETEATERNKSGIIDGAAYQSINTPYNFNDVEGWYMVRVEVQKYNGTRYDTVDTFCFKKRNSLHDE